MSEGSYGKKFAANHVALGINPIAQAQAEKTDVAAALSESVIDLVTQSTNLGKKPPPEIIVGSDVSMASTSSHLGNGGNAFGFSHLSYEAIAASGSQCNVCRTNMIAHDGC